MKRLCKKNKPRCLRETEHVRIDDTLIKCTECGNVVILPVKGYKPKNPFAVEVGVDWVGDRLSLFRI